MTKIFVRERRKVEQGEKKARFRVVAVAGSGLKVRVDHIRKRELEAIAQAVDAEIVYLEGGGDGTGGGTGGGKNA